MIKLHRSKTKETAQRKLLSPYTVGDMSVRSRSAIHLLEGDLTLDVQKTSWEQQAPDSKFAKSLVLLENGVVWKVRWSSSHLLAVALYVVFSYFVPSLCVPHNFYPRHIAYFIMTPCCFVSFFTKEVGHVVFPSSHRASLSSLGSQRWVHCWFPHSRSLSIFRSDVLQRFPPISTSSTTQSRL